MTPHLTMDDLGAGGYDTVIVTAPDMTGRLLGKRLTPAMFRELAEPGIAISTCVFGWDINQDIGLEVPYAGWHTGWRDILMRPDMATLRPAAWLQRTAIVMADLYEPETGELVAVAPRTILRRQLDALAAGGRTAAVGTELEFFLYRENYDVLRTGGYHTMTPSTLIHADYTVQQVNGWEHFFQPLRDALDRSGLQVELSQGEWGLGQWEINLKYGDAMDMADRHALFKLAVRDSAAQAGMSATFMPKPVADQVGSSCHIHLSMTDSGGTPIFHDAAAEHLMSGSLRSAVAGILQHAPALMTFYAPTINSYRRTNSEEFAGHGATWGYDNRTVSCRILGEHPGSVRAEWRVPGADVNPYLAVAALLASASAGIDEGLEPPDILGGDAYQLGADRTAIERFPTTLDESARLLSASPFALRAFGADVVEQYVLAALWEAKVYSHAVTDWEKARYFEFI